MSVWHGVGSEPNLQHKHKQILNEDTHLKKEKGKENKRYFAVSWTSHTPGVVQYIKASLSVNTRETLLVPASSDFKD